MITVYTIYIMMCFTDFVNDPSMRNDIGYAYIITLVALYSLVHNYILCKGSYMRCRHDIRKRKYTKRNKEIMAERAKQKAA